MRQIFERNYLEWKTNNIKCSNLKESAVKVKAHANELVKEKVEFK